MLGKFNSWPLAALILASPSSWAEDALNEIIVTADFHERPASEVPFSVSVMDAAFIDEAAVQHFEELVNVVPNMNWSGDGHRARYFQIRGVGELEQYQGAPNPSIGFLIDDVDFSGIGTVATLFDIASVEVLRGPQGIRYGANALGGLIYMRSAEPSTVRSGRFQLTAGDDDTYSIAAALGGALNTAESMTFRLSAQKHESNGFRDNSYLNRKNTNGRDETSLRTRLRFDVSESFEANIAAQYVKVNNGYDAFSLDNSYTMLSDKPGKDAQESTGLSVRLDWSGLKGSVFTSITSFAESDVDFSFDADWGNDDSWSPVTYDYVSVNDRTRKTVSQEFRLDARQWLLGFHVLNLNEAIITANLGTYYDPFYDFADSLNESFGSDYEATNIALFGQYESEFSLQTRLSGGLRVERRSTDYSDTAGLTSGPAETMWGGELSLMHDVNDGVSVYASLSKGFKAGGFNLGAVPENKRDFGAEEMWTLEAGAKSTLFDKQMQLDIAVFHNRRIDQQVRTSTQLIPGDPASFVFFTDNVGSGKALGLEAEMRWLVSDEWEFYGNVGLLDATMENGREQAHAPLFTLAAGASYRNANGFFARLDVTAKDAFYFDVSHDQRSRPFELANTRIGFDSDTWRLSFWVRNLFDKNYAVRGFFFGNEPPDFPDTLYTRPGDPRHAGITFEKRF
jgi:iron complex outermembrane receptor protein